MKFKVRPGILQPNPKQQSHPRAVPTDPQPSASASGRRRGQGAAAPVFVFCAVAVRVTSTPFLWVSAVLLHRLGPVWLPGVSRCPRGDTRLEKQPTKQSVYREADLCARRVEPAMDMSHPPALGALAGTGCHGGLAGGVPLRAPCPFFSCESLCTAASLCPQVPVGWTAHGQLTMATLYPSPKSQPRAPLQLQSFPPPLRRATLLSCRTAAQAPLGMEFPSKSSRRSLDSKVSHSSVKFKALRFCREPHLFLSSTHQRGRSKRGPRGRPGGQRGARCRLCLLLGKRLHLPRSPVSP